MGKEDTDKKWWKRKRREWWKKEEKASLMFPAKIFRLLLHDASPCPTHTRTLTHSHMYTRSREPFLAPLSRVPHGGACKSRRPYLTMLNFLFTRSTDSWLVNYLATGTGREIQRAKHKDYMSQLPVLRKKCQKVKSESPFNQTFFMQIGGPGFS